MLRGPSVEVNLSALKHNLNFLKGLSGGLPVITVVKADAYGHGAVEVSKALEKEGVLYLAVAFLGEALALRNAGIKEKILILFDTEEPGLFFENSFSPVIHSLKEAKAFSEEASKRKTPIDVHVKVDTGMGRMGLNGGDPEKEILQIASLPDIKITWLMSHFSDVSPDDLDYARLQLERLKSLKDALSRKGINVSCHMSSSASALLLPDSRLEALRTGLLLYGSIPFHSEGKWDLKPVMRVKTKIRALKRFRKGEAVSYERSFITGRDSLIAVLPVGYADGYHRAMSNKAEVIVRGKRAPQVGRICMDLTMIDVTDIQGVSEGDEVILLGGGISHSELAGWAGTNSYEIMTSFGHGRRTFIA